MSKKIMYDFFRISYKIMFNKKRVWNSFFSTNIPLLINYNFMFENIIQLLSIFVNFYWY